MSVQERDDALCRERGWPTVREQKAYWESVQLSQATMQSMSRVLENLTHAVEGLMAICKDQQQQIDNLENQIKCQ